MEREPLLAVSVVGGPGAEPLDVQATTSARSVAIVGASGAGKSTLLRALAGLEPRARGRVVVRGAVWQDDAAGVRVPAWRRGAAWVPQDAQLFPHATVRENLAWSSPDPAELDAVARVLDVAALLDRRPRNLSGGERQRVSLGRALLARPRLLLLDEPFAALDRPLRALVARGVAELCRARDLPLVVVSHDDADVSALAEVAWRMSAGRLRAE